MKKWLSLLLVFALMATSGAFALNYQPHMDNEATFETLEEARVNGPAYLSTVNPGRVYVADPALNDYPVGTTFVYRSKGIYTNASAAFRMNTNFLVYTDEVFEDAAAAYAYIDALGFKDLADEATGSVVLVTPSDPAAGFGAADQYAFFLLQSVMCNLGGSARGENGTTYFADNTYYGGLTYRYLFGIDGGATFINNFIASTEDYISRIAGLLLYGGSMEDIRTVKGLIPVYLVNAPAKVVEKYKTGNHTDAYGYQDDETMYFNQANPLQYVAVGQADELTAELVSDVYHRFMIKALRVPVLRANMNVASTLYANYNFNQAPYTLSKRNAIINGHTNDGMVMLEKVEDRFDSVQTTTGEYLQTWYEFLPEEVLNNTAAPGSVPLWLANHGGGDDPVQYLDEIGLLSLAGEKRFAVVAPEQQSIGAIRSTVLPMLVRYMLETYPALDATRVYATGYSMGGSATFNAVSGDARLFAAIVPMAAAIYRANEEEMKQYAEIDIPVLFTTSTYDHFYDANFVFKTSATSRLCDYPTLINDYLGFNEMPTIEEYDFDTYPLRGFPADIYRYTVLNNEYGNHTWLVRNAEGIPMLGLNVTEFLPHGLYPEYAKIAYDFAMHYTRDLETGAVVFSEIVY